MKKAYLFLFFLFFLLLLFIVISELFQFYFSLKMNSFHETVLQMKNNLFSKSKIFNYFNTALSIYKNQDVPPQSNVTPSSVSGIQIEETPPSRASQSRKLQSKSPAVPIVTPRPEPAKQKSQAKEEEVKVKEKSVHEKKSTPLPRNSSAQKSKSAIVVKQNAPIATEKLKLPSIVARQKTDVPNKVKRQVLHI